VQLVVSIRAASSSADVTGDPWNAPHAGMGHRVAAAGLELRDPAACRPDRCFSASKQLMGAKLDKAAQSRKYEPIEMPKNSPTGFVTAFFAVVTGFALIWHIWWLAALGAFGAFMTFLAFASAATTKSRYRPSGLPVRSASLGGGCAMNIVVAIDDARHDAHPHARAGPAPKRIVVAYGFWIFLLSDIVMFATLFCDLRGTRSVDGGRPTGAQLFNQGTVAIETACLLASSYTCGLMALAIGSRRSAGTCFGALITFALGARSWLLNSESSPT